jgi:hypothetical protein
LVPTHPTDTRIRTLRVNQFVVQPLVISLAMIVGVNALTESLIGLFKTEVIRRLGPWRHLEAVEFATLDWVD